MERSLCWNRDPQSRHQPGVGGDVGWKASRQGRSAENQPTPCRLRSRGAYGGRPADLAFDPAKRSVQIGDIIVSDRQEFITRGKIKTTAGVVRGDILHGDIVVLVNAGRRFAETIGGNVHISVWRRRYPVDGKGNLIQDEKQLFDQEDNSGAFSGAGLTLPGA